MLIESLVDKKNVDYTCKVLKHYGKAMLCAQEAFSDVKKTDPNIAKTLTETAISTAPPEELTPLQKQFKQLYEHRDKLKAKLNELNYPVLETGFAVAVEGESDFKFIKQAMEKLNPHKLVINRKSDFAIFITTEKDIEHVKETLSQDFDISSESFIGINKQNIPPMFVGMTTPNQVRLLLDEIDHYQSKKPPNIVYDLDEQRPS